MPHSRKAKDVFWLDRKLPKSKAFLSLKRISLQVLIIFHTKCQMAEIKRSGQKEWMIKNNGEIEFTYLEAERKYGLSKRQFTTALDHLVEKGFIDVSHAGAAFRGDKSKYALSDRWRKYGTDEFEVVERKKDLVQRGFRKPKKVEAE